MDSRELGGLIWRIGFLGLLCSFAWWGVFYLTVPGDLDRMLPCLISSAGPCSFANWMVGWVSSVPPYQPVFFWISWALIGIGLVMANGASSSSENPALPAAGASGAVSSYDANKWNVLIEVDPEIAAAASQLEAFGPGAVAELAAKYLALNDKQYLNAIVAQLVQKHKGNGVRPAGTDPWAAR